MCLCSHNVKPFVCDKDIVVYKLFVKDNDGKFVIPYQMKPIKLGEVMQANGTLPELPLDYSDNQIGEGVIHAYIKDDIIESVKNYGLFAKAIIKAGTPFFVQFGMEEIASRELFITEEIVEGNGHYDEVFTNLKETREVIYNLMREQISSNNGVKVGDILLSDKKTFVSPDNIKKDMKIIGVVSYIRGNGQPHIVSLKQECHSWYKNRYCDTLVNVVNSYNEAVNDFNGKEYTERLLKEVKNKLSDYPALEYCAEYFTEGTQKGDWVFDSTGEILQTIRNAYLVNVTIDKINKINPNIKAEPIIYGAFYWASAEYSQTYAWLCGTGNAGVGGNYGKWYSHCVRPSLSLDVAQA